MPPRLVVFLTLLVVVAPSTAVGQIVRGTVREAESGSAIESGVVTLLDPDGVAVRAALTDSLGEFALRAPVAGAYRLRFERLGFRPTTSDHFTLDASETETKTLRATAVSISLEQIVITDRPRCRVLPEADTLTARVWSSVRAVLAVTAAGEIGLYPYVTIERYERDYDHRRNLVTKERKWTSTGATTAPFVALAAGELEKHGFVRQHRDSLTFYAPEARTLIAEEFLRTHCFRVRDERAERSRVGLDIEPVPGRLLPDIKGTLWLDAASGELRRLEFVFVNLPPNVPRQNADGWVEFRRLPRGAWIVDRWALRLPLIGKPPGAAIYGSGVPFAGELPVERGRDWIGTHEEGGRVLSLDTQRPRAPGASTTTVALRGSVRTASGEPVPGARAFLSGTGHSAVTDRDGWFEMLDVTPARFRLSFTHPRFDTLSIVGPVVEVDATGAEEHHLTMPADEEIARSACGAQETERSDQPATLLYGYVRDGSSLEVVPAAIVTVAWRVPVVRGPSVGVRDQTVEVQSDATGRYQICAVPREIQLSVRANKGARRGVAQSVDPIVSPVNRLDVPLAGRRPQDR